MCQNINKFISHINSCNSSDVAKCESCLSTVNDTLNSASDLRSSIDNKRKELFLDDHTLKSFAGDELAYLDQRRITTLHEDLQSASNKLTTARISTCRRSFLYARKNHQRQEERRKIRGRSKKTKEKRLEQRARHLLGNLTSIEVAGQIFGTIEENDRVTPVACVDSINADFAKKLTRRLHLDPLLWLLEKGIFNTTLAKNLEQVTAILRAQSPGSTCRGGLNVVVESDDEAQAANEVVESDNEAQEVNEVVELDDEAQDEADEAVESDLV